MSPEGESFEFHEEYSALNRSDADKGLNEALNKMGSAERVARESEIQEERDFDQEQEKSDTDARHNFLRLEYENVSLASTMEDINDLTKKCGLPDYLSLGSILENLTDGNEVNALTQAAEKSSRFSQRPERVSKFVADMKKMVAAGTVTLDMSLTKIVGVLEEKHQENEELVERGKTLRERDTERDRLTQFLDMCKFVANAPRELIKSLKVERFTSTKEEDLLVITMVPGSDETSYLSMRLRRIPRASVEKNGKYLIFSAPVEKRFLEQAKLVYPMMW
jgi:hypothetical protein